MSAYKAENMKSLPILTLANANTLAKITAKEMASIGVSGFIYSQQHWPVERGQ